MLSASCPTRKTYQRLPHRNIVYCNPTKLVIIYCMAMIKLVVVAPVLLSFSVVFIASNAKIVTKDKGPRVTKSLYSFVTHPRLNFIWTPFYVCCGFCEIKKLFVLKHRALPKKTFCRKKITLRNNGEKPILFLQKVFYNFSIYRVLLETYLSHVTLTIVEILRL